MCLLQLLHMLTLSMCSSVFVLGYSSGKNSRSGSGRRRNGTASNAAGSDVNCRSLMAEVAKDNTFATAWNQQPLELGVDLATGIAEPVACMSWMGSR